MIRYFFHIGYKGKAYKGWQRQNNVLSVQEVLEDKLSDLLKTPVVCIGCGRTDAGVHASQYFFHADLSQKWDEKYFFLLNKILPSDIALFDVIEAGENQHAQLHATERTYDYFIHTQKSPFLSDLSSLYSLNLDVVKMNEAALLLLKYTDFRCFCKSPDRHNHTICQIYSVRLFTDASGKKIRFQIKANRFLKGMIRIIVNQLLEIGSGTSSIEEFESYLISKTPPRFLNMAYPQGLYLSEIKYPFLEVPATNQFCPHLETNEWFLVRDSY